MAVIRRRHAHDKDGRRKHVSELSERLAPLEELGAAKAAEQAGGNGDVAVADDTIRVDSSKLKLPGKLVDEDRDVAGVFRLDPLVIVILAAFLCFVAFIAWQITLMPPPAK